MNTQITQNNFSLFPFADVPYVLSLLQTGHPVGPLSNQRDSFSINHLDVPKLNSPTNSLLWKYATTGAVIVGIGALSVLASPEMALGMGALLLLGGCGVSWKVDFDEDNDGFNYDGDPADCNDYVSSIHPGATEVPYDGIDQNCDGSDSIDVDGDGQAAIVAGGTDCDDNNSAVYMGAVEDYLNEVDDDCDGVIDDQDGDGYTITNGGDCDDVNNAINPGITETCNQIDDNCNGIVDENFPTTVSYEDKDSDGYGNTDVSVDLCLVPEGYVEGVSGDCDDTNGSINPSASERCDSVDNDCNGLIDDGLNESYLDADGDGYGDPNNSLPQCQPPTGYVDNGDDCDDSKTSVNPSVGQSGEISNNGIDENCDGYDFFTVGCNSASATSIQLAVDDADAAADASGLPQEVYICAGTYNECKIEVPCNNIEIVGETSTVLQGPCGAQYDYFIQTNGCNDSSSTSISNIEFQGGDNNVGIRVLNSNVTIDNCTFEHNLPAITVDTATSVSVSNSYFQDNREPIYGWGGALWAKYTNYVSLDNVDIESNDNGLSFNQTSFDISNSSLTNNNGNGGGGAIVIFDSQGSITNTTIDGNYSAFNGGAIFLGTNTGTTIPYLSISNSSVTNNTASGDGGGVYLSNGSLNSSNTDWGGNSTTAIYIDGGQAYGSGDSPLTNSSFTCSESSSVCE